MENTIIEDYEAWDGSDGVDQFARTHDISKQTLYALLRRRGVRTKKERAYMGAETGSTAAEAGVADWLIDKVAQQALKTILEENRTVHLLEDRIARLERAMTEAGLDPDLV